MSIEEVKRKIVVNGFPKAGTNLVQSVLELIPGLSARKKGMTFIFNKGLKKYLQDIMSLFENKIDDKKFIYGVDWPRKIPIIRAAKIFNSLKPNEYMQAHIPFSTLAEELIRENEICLIVILRDPRDIVVSHYKYVMNSKNHFLYKYYNDIISNQEKLMLSIIGIEEKSNKKPKLLNIRDRISLMTKWEQSFHGHTVKFESLVGPKGGGDLRTQIKEIKKIFNIISIPNENNIVENIANNLFGIGKTFRKGKISSWKDEFNVEHKEVFKKCAGDLLIGLGYEKDYSW